MSELTQGQITTQDPQHDYAVRIDPGPRDFSALNEVVRKGSRIGNERLEGDDHLNEVIPKPWGMEYRIYVDDFIDVWNLKIEQGQSTSMHVHPRKLTYLLCLAGQGVTDTLTEQYPVGAGTILRIGGGAFHSTRSVGPGPLWLVEVEAPRNKFDLIRLRDNYARENTAYETEHAEAPDLPAQPVSYLPQARLREKSPGGEFAFGIRAGMDVFYRRQQQDLFHVPLGLTGVVTGEVDILAPAQGDARRPALDQYYLSLSLA
ncbi:MULTISPECIES: cupin domain-containing protein [unclassified Streptomyces]|uniref:cupin domain-containing protein n=1 Tax=unclassified Streptomyces TaxID=2593676 RepID=UPI0035D7FA9D